MSKDFIPARSSLGQQVVEYLREGIYNANIAPGTHLNAVDIANQLGVSRSPVRDALIMLATEGLVEQASSSGYQVIQFNEKLIRDVFTVRLALEPVALSQGMASFEPSFADEQIDFWSTLKQQDITSAEFRENFVQADNKLHDVFVNSSQNKLLRELLDKVIRLGMAIRHWQHKHNIMMEEISATMEEHIALLEAIKSGDEKQAAEVLTLHIKNSQQRALNRFFNFEAYQREGKDAQDS